MHRKLKNILFVSGGYPHKDAPSNCPFIGYRLAYLQKQGIQADILSLQFQKIKKRKSLKRIAAYIIITIIPIISIEQFIFLEREYKIYKIIYNSISRMWLPIILLILSKKNKYSLFHYHFLWFTKELSYLKNTIRIPSIITVHGSDLHVTAVRDNYSYVRFKKAIEYADKIIYVSNGLKKIAKSIGLDTDRDITIYNGFDPNYCNIRKTRFSDALTLGFVGHLYKEKRADKLPEIFMHIKKRIPDAKMIIVGGGEEEHNLKYYMYNELEKYNILIDVKFIGEVPPKEVGKYYRMMDILLFPSLNEGFGTVAIEARACGVPVVGSSNGGIPEAIGNSGIVVEEGEKFEERFAESVVNYYQALPTVRSIQNGVKDLSWDNIINKEIKLYKGVLEHVEK